MLNGQILGQNELSGNIQAQVINNGGGSGIEIDGVAQDKGFLRFKGDNAHFETILPDSEVTAESENIVSSGAVSKFVSDNLLNYYLKEETNNQIDTKIADLVNSAPETLDTLGEVAQAIQENESVVDALNSAIGNKVDKTDLENEVKTIVGGHITLTQAEYDALVSAGTVDANTYYYIKEE